MATPTTWTSPPPERRDNGTQTPQSPVPVKRGRRGRPSEVQVRDSPVRRSGRIAARSRSRGRDSSSRNPIQYASPLAGTGTPMETAGPANFCLADMHTSPDFSLEGRNRETAKMEASPIAEQMSNFWVGLKGLFLNLADPCPPIHPTDASLPAASSEPAVADTDQLQQGEALGDKEEAPAELDGMVPEGQKTDEPPKKPFMLRWAMGILSAMLSLQLIVHYWAWLAVSDSGATRRSPASTVPRNEKGECQCPDSTSYFEKMVNFSHGFLTWMIIGLIKIIAYLVDLILGFFGVRTASSSVQTLHVAYSAINKLFL